MNPWIACTKLGVNDIHVFNQLYVHLFAIHGLLTYAHIDIVDHQYLQNLQIRLYHHLYECSICHRISFVELFYTHRNQKPWFFTGNCHGKSPCIPFSWEKSMEIPASFPGKNQPLLDLQHVLLTGTVAPGHVQGLENNVGAPNWGEHAKVHLPR